MEYIILDDTILVTPHNASDVLNYLIGNIDYDGLTKKT
jgi:hypothetical protein